MVLANPTPPFVTFFFLMRSYSSCWASHILKSQTLYESAVAFGMRKALQTEQGKNEMEARIQQLEAECAEKERQVKGGGSVALLACESLLY